VSISLYPEKATMLTVRITFLYVIFYVLQIIIINDVSQRDKK